MKRANFAKLAVVPVMAAAVLLTGVAIQAQTAPQKTTAKEKAAAKATIDLNKATAEELEELPGVGPATAKKIIAGRPYTKVDDLAKAGVPARVITSIRSKVHVGEATAAKAKAKSTSDAPSQRPNPRKSISIRPTRPRSKIFRESVLRTPRPSSRPARSSRSTTSSERQRPRQSRGSTP